LEAWRIEKVSQGMPAGGPSAISLDSSDFPSAGAEKKSDTSSTDEDDLPF